ncbi:MAG: ABC transporter permease [Planctomycetota bacterium]
MKGLTMVLQRIAGVGDAVLDGMEGLGKFTVFSGRVVAGMWPKQGWGPVRNWRLLVPQLYLIGTRSVPVIMLVGAFVGAVLGLETFAQFAAFGQETRLGGVIHLSVVKQIGPVLAAVMIAGRVGGSVAAEIGTMRVTEQVEALRVMGANPVRYLAVPRVVACVLMVPVLTVISDLMGIVGGYLVVVVAYGVEAEAYWDFSAYFVTSYDVVTGLIKAVFFGLAIGLVSCFKGFNCKAGAAGVGRAATDAFVTSFIAIIVLNFLLAKFLADLQVLIWGANAAFPGG